MEITITKKSIKEVKTYVLKWQFKFDNKYKVSTCKKIINTETNKVLKESLNSMIFGYWFGKRFIAKKNLNKYIELIPINE